MKITHDSYFCGMIMIRLDKASGKNKIRIREMTDMWALFALGSAVFAALTSILAKMGIEGVNSNLATAIRTVV